MSHAPIVHINATELLKIKCTNCGIVKQETAFEWVSVLDVVKMRLLCGDFQPEIHSLIVCIPCTPKDPVEAECLGCGVWKGIDDFSSKYGRRSCIECADAMATSASGNNIEKEDHAGTAEDNVGASMP